MKLQIPHSSLFGKPLNEVTVNDVKLFCDKQIKEGINLDYKKDLNPKSIVKAIAAMGNTRGGWLIVGVEDKDDKPHLPVVGMDFVEHIELTITNIVLSHMSSPLIPIIHVCPPDKDDKTFVIMYVPESIDAPHWLFNKKELYVRVEQRTDHTDWERFATADEWEWLRNKREKSISRRSEVKENLNYYFLNYIDKDSLEKSFKEKRSAFLPSINIPTNHVFNRDGTEKMLNLYISPSFPSDSLLTVNETYDKLLEIATRDVYGTSDRFPIFLDDRVVYQSGTIAFNQLDNNRNYFTALDITGMLVYKETVVYEKKPADEDRITDLSYVDFDRIVIRLEEFLSIASNLFTSINYQGLLSIDIHLDGEDWMRMKFPTQHFHPRQTESANGQFRWSKSFLASEIRDSKSSNYLLRETVENLMYAFGWKDFDWNIFETTIKNFHPKGS